MLCYKFIRRKNKKHEKTECDSESQDPFTPIHPMEQIDIFLKILPHIRNTSDLRNLRQVCRAFQQYINSSTVFKNYIKTLCPEIATRDVKQFSNSTYELPWTKCKFKDITKISFFRRDEFLMILRQIGHSTSNVEITEIYVKRKILSSRKHKIEQLCIQEGLQVNWKSQKVKKCTIPNHQEVQFTFNPRIISEQNNYNVYPFYYMLDSREFW